MTQIDVSFSAATPVAAVDDAADAPLSVFRRGDRGVIVRVSDDGHAALAEGELERRLLELGFVEGATVELLHEGAFGRDPIAVRIDDMRVALRRREAANIFVRRAGHAA